jgi:hypothetical protein
MLSHVAPSKQESTRAPQLPGWAHEKDLPTAEMPPGPFDFSALPFKKIKRRKVPDILVAAIPSNRLDDYLLGEAQRDETKMTSTKREGRTTRLS